MEIRRAELGDIRGLVDLWVEFMDFHSSLDADFVRSKGASARWTDYITGKLDDDTYRILVAHDGDTIAGYVVAIVQEYPPIRTIEKFGFVQEIAVADRFRRQGIARRLFEAAEEWLLSTGVPHIEVRIDVANEASQRLFRGEGFTPHTETLIKKFGNDA